MIQLTLQNGEKWNVNPDHIIEVQDRKGGGAIVTTSHFYGRHVKESRKEVAQKSLEWQKTMEEFQAAYYLTMSREKPDQAAYDLACCEKKLRELAGLEGKKRDEG